MRPCRCNKRPLLPRKLRLVDLNLIDNLIDGCCDYGSDYHYATRSFRVYRFSLVVYLFLIPFLGNAKIRVMLPLSERYCRECVFFTLNEFVDLILRLLHKLERLPKKVYLGPLMRDNVLSRYLKDLL